MMEIKLTVDILGIPEALNNLAAAIRGQAASAPVAASAPTTPAVAPTQSAEVPSAPAPVAPVTPAPVQKKKITADDIAYAGAALVDQGKMADVINLLKRYNVQAITQLKEDTYPAFANDLRALGATI